MKWKLRTYLIENITHFHMPKHSTWNLSWKNRRRKEKRRKWQIEKLIFYVEIFSKMENYRRFFSLWKRQKKLKSKLKFKSHSHVKVFLSSSSSFKEEKKFFFAEQKKLLINTTFYFLLVFRNFSNSSLIVKIKKLNEKMIQGCAQREIFMSKVIEAE